ncbi:MAG: hypothetical protein AB7U75_14670 [Hyphomicrobiaceae bacterium]
MDRRSFLQALSAAPLLPVKDIVESPVSFDHIPQSQLERGVDYDVTYGQIIVHRPITMLSLYNNLKYDWRTDPKLIAYNFPWKFEVNEGWTIRNVRNILMSRWTEGGMSFDTLEVAYRTKEVAYRAETI